MNIFNEEFNKMKAAAEDSYKKIDSVFCHFFNVNIKFNTKGLNHIKMKSWNRARSISDQYLRLKFISLAPKIISKSGTLQEFKEMSGLERCKIDGEWQEKRNYIRYYGFVAIIDGVRVKVIIKRTSRDNIFFWSIIPFWKHENDLKSGKIKKVFHEGDLNSQ